MSRRRRRPGACWRRQRNCRPTLFCNRAARVKGSKLVPAPRMVAWQGHSSVQGRRVRPPQVGVRRGRGASISEAARSPIERARSVTAEGLSMSPLPRVPAGRFRRSGTRDFAEARERLFCGPWSRDNPGRRSDGGASASGREGVKAGEAPGAAGTGLDARAPRCGTLIIGSPPRSGLSGRGAGWRIRLPLPAEVRCRPATSGA